MLSGEAVAVYCDNHTADYAQIELLNDSELEGFGNETLMA
jgi:hypothetical protein